jgi:hypothetical protein
MIVQNKRIPNNFLYEKLGKEPGKFFLDPPTIQESEA